MRAIQLLRGLTILSLVVTPLVVQHALFAQNCPGTQPHQCACPDAYPVCTGFSPCSGNGSVVWTGNWECLFNNTGLQCLTSPNPDNGVPCYTVYTCYAVTILQSCVPNTNVAGQVHNKIIKISNQCPNGG